MSERIELITSIIEVLPNIKISQDFNESYGDVGGKIQVQLTNVVLEFDIEIKPPYPLQFHETESIRFINPKLLEYNHVNGDGSICIHTHHSPNLEEKLRWDFESLKDWVRNYYILKNKDSHYEHIIVNEYQGDILSTYLFTEINHNFIKNTFGNFIYTLQAEGQVGKRKRLTFLIKGLYLGNSFNQCNWSKYYIEPQQTDLIGLYVYIENPPVKHRRFIVESWTELETFVSQKFLKFLYNLNKSGYFKKKELKQFPLLIGYKISSGEIHWQCAIIDTNNFPNETVKLDKDWGGAFKDMPIKWSSTKNISYKYFFGRGKLTDKITDKKILIVGIGAVGSIVANTLTRGGCRFLSLVDYDVKEPENICRSEYDFSSGINDKVFDLGLKLVSISPFIEIIPDAFMMDALKYFVNNSKLQNNVIKRIEEFDIIIDCTADDDVTFILDTLDLKSELISLSITNNANELLCSVKPNLYEWLKNRDSFIKKNDEPLYAPTGCWSPTFKASYNDINVLVQFALKHINFTIESGKQLRHFYLSTELEKGFNIKLNQF